MKTRFAVVTVIGLAGSFVISSMGALPPKSPPLANYDKRLEAPRQTAVNGAAGWSAAQQQSAATLNSLVPGLQIRPDRIFGTPAFVAASRGFLTGPGGEGEAVSAAYLSAIPTNDTHRVIKAFLNEHSALFGHDSGVLASARVSQDYVTENNGLHTTVWEQTLDGIQVFDGLLVGHVTRDGELVSLESHFVPDAAAAADAGTPNRATLVAQPAISAGKAIELAAANAGTAVPEALVSATDQADGPEKNQTFASSGLAGPAWVRLVWLPTDRDSMRLCWRVIFTVVRSQPERYTSVVDAETGEVLVRQSMTRNISPATYNVFTSDSPSPFSPGSPTPSSTQPPLVDRVLVTTSALDTNASPLGWITDGNRQTSGNNAEAFLDRNFDGLPDVPLPQGAGTNRTFDFPLDLTQQPTTYQSASTVQLFYRANWYHDRLYQLGFTEAAGNYQVSNFGRGGEQADPVLCLVQAGADVGLVDNSAFLPAPDGFSGYCLMFVFTGPSPDRDGSLDQEVVIHELTHGLTERLVGAGVGISALQSAGMGEGWSDFYSLCMLSEPTDDVNAVYAEGGYVTFNIVGIPFDQNYYFGIRRYPYTTDMSKNPLTFKDIDPSQASAHFGIPTSPLFGATDASEVHNQGEVWCMTLREMWANLVTTWGWDVGNELALQLVTDSLKLMPANPTFLDARDAIIRADQVDTGGENYVDIWLAFAKRGMGSGAVSPRSDTTFGVLESFDLPADASPDGILEVNVSPASGSVLFFGEAVPIKVRVTDARPVTNATISATLSTGGTLTFKNDGVAPDERPGDSTYTALFNVPSNQTSVTITMVISAPDKDTRTNVVTYLTFPPPPNDNFANAIKVPVGGTNYVTNNKRATIEPNEPAHAGDAQVAGSLWWNYTAASTAPLLVDTVGSDFRTVIAVYTNSSLSTLAPVVSSIGTTTRKSTYVLVPMIPGVTYRIAVAGFSSNTLGTLRLDIAPGLLPDTNAPTVTINSPTNGILVTTNRLTVSGSAVDSTPNASGIRDINITVAPIPTYGPPVTTTVTPLNLLLGPANTNWSSIVGLFPGLDRIQVSATDFAGNRSSPVTIQVTYRPLDPPNDFFANALSLTATPEVSSVNTLDATKEAGEPNHAGVIGGKSAWWVYQPPGDGVLTLSTTNSTFDTLLAIYTGNAVNNLTPVAGNDDAYDGAPGGFSQIVQAVKSNQVYHIAVDGYDGAAGVVFLSYSFVPAPLFHLTATATTGGTVSPASIDVQSNGVAVLSATPDANAQFDYWDGDIFSLNNPVAVTVRSNMTVTAHFRPIIFSDGFESGDFLHLSWITNNNMPWTIQTNTVAVGLYAARSGVIGNSQSSSLILTTNFRAGTGSFDYKVSSDPNSDFLKFLVDGIVLQQWSGEAGWGNYAFPLTSGTHTLEWRYSKDPAFASGLDAAFIDDVNLPLFLPTDSSAPAHLEVKRQTDGSPFIELLGQTNQTYVIQGSTDLIHWQDISTQIAVDGILRFPITTSNAVQFYRAVVPQ